MKTTCAHLLLILALVCPGAAWSESHPQRLISEIRVGIMAHDVATRVNKHESGQDFNGELFFRPFSAQLMEYLGSPRPSVGIAVNNHNQTSQFYSGLNWQARFLHRLFFSLGLGGSIHNGELQSTDPEAQRLGSRVLFRLALAAGFTLNERMNVSALFDHCSNGHLAYPNNGLEKLGIQFGFTY